MVRLGQHSTKMISTQTIPDDKIGGKVGNCQSEAVWLCRRLGSFQGGLIPAPGIFLWRCRRLKGTIATPPLPTLEPIKKPAVCSR
jgi:hypothetical protein